MHVNAIRGYRKIVIQLSVNITVLQLPNHDQIGSESDQIGSRIKRGSKKIRLKGRLNIYRRFVNDTAFFFLGSAL